MVRCVSFLVHARVLFRPGLCLGSWTGGVHDYVSCFVCGFVVGCHILDTSEPFREVDLLFQKTFS